MKTLRATIVFSMFMLPFGLPAVASHLRSVEITARPLDCPTFTYEITVTAYLFAGSSVPFGGDDAFLAFGDGQQMMLPEQTATLIDARLQVSRVIFKTTHTYAGPGAYTLTFSEFNRNEGILNVTESVNARMVTETWIVVERGQCNSSPLLPVPPIDRACGGITFHHNPGANDADDDSLSYELVAPAMAPGQPVTGFKSPASPDFYGTNYGQGNEDGDGPPFIAIDAAAGTLTWNAPGAVGEYVIAIRIREWRYNTTDSTWHSVGYVVRDMQILVEDCLNRKPELQVPDDICVMAGTRVAFRVTGSDPDFDDVRIEVFSTTLWLEESPATVGGDSVLQSTRPPNDTAAVVFNWNTTCAHVKDQYYQVVFKITDQPADGPRLTTFRTVHITVLAPPPVYEAVTVNPVSKQVTLQWDAHACHNVTGFQVWRRVSAYNYAQPACGNGMPAFLRYRLLTVLPADAVAYTDTNLNIGALYCYRIVALIGAAGIPSRLSLDTCLIPKPAEAPVITNVSVLRTSATDGDVEIRWTSPFDIDQTQYPPPYAYKVYRAPGLEQTDSYQLITPEALTDTVFTDGGVNTEGTPYRYFVELYVPSLTPAAVDSSSVASSVWLQTSAEVQSIALQWEANTPWYNYAQLYPGHYVYRRENNADGPFTLIGSPDVNEGGFAFVDNDPALRMGVTYYYRVTTQGTYGNPAIPEPLQNLSQASAIKLRDTVPPCAPVVTGDKTDCRNSPCSGRNYTNILHWTDGDAACAADVARYRVYVAETEGDVFALLASTAGTTFTHAALASRAKCYRVTAIDEAGNESGPGETICFDNCPYFELPNVFTPGNNDERNDFFAAFTAGSRDSTRCARFVKTVDLTVYDRWGQEVYSIESVVPDAGYIFWDGLSPSGKPVSPGVYYYSATVQFDARDPRRQQQQYKGWVQVLH